MLFYILNIKTDPNPIDLLQQYCESHCQKCSEITEENINFFKCKQCPKTQYGTSNLSNDGANCLECSKLCLSCRIRSEEDIKKINPQFEVTNENRIYTNICLRAFEDSKVKIDQQTQIAYYCFDENCSRNLEKQFFVQQIKNNI